MPSYYTGEDLAQSATLAKLQNFLNSPRQGSFEDFERGLGQHMRQLECDIKAAEMVRYDVVDDTISIGGAELRKCLSSEPKTYLTASGPVTVSRNLFRASAGGKSVCPLELRVGMIGCCTPLLARQACFLMGHMTSSETASVFAEMGIVGPSSSTCDRLPKLVNPHWEKNREAWESALREAEVVPPEATVLAVSLDGVMVADKAGQCEAKIFRAEAEKGGKGKVASGPAGYREVGCGTVSLYAPEQESTDEDKQGPQRLETIRYARAPEYKKRTLTEQLDAEVAAILAIRPDLVTVALADGAEENWRYFEGPRWGTAIKIVDHGHASQHLKTAVAAAYPDPVDARAEYERLRLILRDKEGGVDTVIRALDKFDRRLAKKNSARPRELLAKERTYFRNQRHRMDYARYQELGLPIGSGVVEAACKTLAAQRLKRSGMNWGNGKQPILTIRSLQQSNRWETAWRLLAADFRTSVARVEHHGHLRSIETIATPGMAA